MLVKHGIALCGHQATYEEFLLLGFQLHLSLPAYRLPARNLKQPLAVSARAMRLPSHTDGPLHLPCTRLPTNASHAIKLASPKNPVLSLIGRPVLRGTRDEGLPGHPVTSWTTRLRHPIQAFLSERLVLSCLDYLYNYLNTFSSSSIFTFCSWLSALGPLSKWTNPLHEHRPQTSPRP